MKNIESCSRNKAELINRRKPIAPRVLLVSLFMLLQSINAQAQSTCNVSGSGKRDIVFFLDNSGSVNGEEFEQMKVAINLAAGQLLGNATDVARTRITVVNWGCNGWPDPISSGNYYNDCAVSGAFLVNNADGVASSNLMWSNNPEDFLLNNLCRSYGVDDDDNQICSLSGVNQRTYGADYAQSAFLTLRHLLFGDVEGGESLSPLGGAIHQNLQSSVRADAQLILVHLTDATIGSTSLIRENPSQEATYYRFSNELKNNHGAKIVAVGIGELTGSNEVKRQLSAIASRADSSLADVPNLIDASTFYDIQHDCNEVIPGNPDDNPTECNGVVYSPTTNANDVLKDEFGEVVPRLAIFNVSFGGNTIGNAIKKITDTVQAPGISVTSAPNPSQTGTEVILTANVNGGTPGDEVAFYSGDGNLSPITCTNTNSQIVPLVALDGSESDTVAQCRTRFDTAGNLTLTVAYSGCNDLAEPIFATSEHEVAPSPPRIERITPAAGAGFEVFGGKQGIRFAVISDEPLDVTENVVIEVRADNGVGDLAVSVDPCTIIDGVVRCVPPPMQEVRCDVATPRCVLDALPAGESRSFFVELLPNASNVRAVITVQGRDVATLPLP